MQCASPYYNPLYGHVTFTCSYNSICTSSKNSEFPDYYVYGCCKSGQPVTSLVTSCENNAGSIGSNSLVLYCTDPASPSCAEFRLTNIDSIAATPRGGVTTFCLPAADSEDIEETISVLPSGAVAPSSVVSTTGSSTSPEGSDASAFPSMPRSTSISTSSAMTSSSESYYAFEPTSPDFPRDIGLLVGLLAGGIIFCSLILWLKHKGYALKMSAGKLKINTRKPREPERTEDSKTASNTSNDPKMTQHTANDDISALDGTSLRETFQDTNDSIRTADDWFDKLKEAQAVIRKGRRSDNAKVKIAILDTGFTGEIDKEHWYDFTGSGLQDNVGHGTYNVNLITKVAPDAEIYIAKVLNSAKVNNDTARHVANAIVYAINEWKVNIITISLGFVRPQNVILHTIDKLPTKAIMFAAVSNEGESYGPQSVAFPARASPFIAVGSADGYGAKSKFTPKAETKEEIPIEAFSAVGESVDCSLPAEINRNTGTRQTGSSFATPIIAAVAALILEFGRQRTMIEIPPELESSRGMRAILKSMSTKKDGYFHVTPWIFFTVRRPIEDIRRRIVQILEDEL